MFKNLVTMIAAGTILASAQITTANAFVAGSALNSLETSSIVPVHSKRCKFYHPDGYKYKAHCPHEFKKGSRKKRAGIGAGIGAATGAVIGAIAGGGKGAAIGAAAGAGAGALGGAASVKKCWYFDSRGRKVRVRCKQ